MIPGEIITPPGAPDLDLNPGLAKRTLAVANVFLLCGRCYSYWRPVISG